MGCEKAWELMMSRLDGEIDRQNQRYLENHLKLCPECRRQYDSLHAVLLELDRTKPVAPESTERKVMERISGARRKETVVLLPYVIPPAALLMGILTFLFYELCMDGPMAFLDKATQALSTFLSACRSIAAFSRFLFSGLYLHSVLIMSGLAFLGGIFAFLYGQLGKGMKVKRTGGQ